MSDIAPVLFRKPYLLALEEPARPLVMKTTISVSVTSTKDTTSTTLNAIILVSRASTIVDKTRDGSLLASKLLAGTFIYPRPAGPNPHPAA